MTYMIWNETEAWLVNYDSLEDVEDFIVSMGIQLSTVHIDKMAW